MKKKYESMFVVHVRYDINSDVFQDANDVHYYINSRVKQFIDHSLYVDQPTYEQVFVPSSVDVDIADRMNGLKAHVSFTGVVDSIISEASDSRRTPNVWMAGRLMSLSASIRDWMSSVRSIRPNDRFITRARQFDSNDIPGENVLLPTLPLNTMRMIVNKCRERFVNADNSAWCDAMKESTLDVLDGLFEDGLPIDRELTANEIGSGAEPF